MNNKLAIGLSIIGIVFLIFLLMNYSSSEMLEVTQHALPTTAIATIPESVMGSFRGKQFLLIDGDNIKVADATVFNDIFHSAAVQAQNRAMEKINQQAQNLQSQLSDATNSIDNYKSLIGPGPNTVLGQPKNFNGEELSSDSSGGEVRVGNRSQREQWGSHGILGDLYRYDGSGIANGNTRSQEAWGNTWITSNSDSAERGRRRRPNQDCNSTNGCNSYAEGIPNENNGSNWSWERVILRSDEERPTWHGP